MKAEEVKLYREIQKGADMAIKAIDTIADKVYDDNLAMQISRQSLKYSELKNRATDKLLQGRSEPYRENHVTDIMLAGGIHYNTLFNTSTSHIAELMIQGSNRGMIQICKTMNQCPAVGNYCMEMAKEFVDFEEKNIERLKKYL